MHRNQTIALILLIVYESQYLIFLINKILRKPMRSYTMVRLETDIL